MPKVRKLKSWEINKIIDESDSEFSDELPEAVEEAWMKDQEDIIAEERPIEENIEDSLEEDPMVAGILQGFIIRPGQENEENPSAALPLASPSSSAALPPASPPPSFTELLSTAPTTASPSPSAALPSASPSPSAALSLASPSAALPPASPSSLAALPPVSASPLTLPSDPPLGVPFSSDDDDDEYDFGPVSARPLSKKRTDIPSEIGSGGLGKTRKLVQPLAKRPRIPWKKTEEQQDHVRPMDFKPINPGIQVDIPDEFDELAALMLFLPDDFWDTIATESNRYYRQKSKAAVKRDITPAEARTYIGIMILLGLSPPHSLRTPWTRNSTFRNDVISSCMTFSRFIDIHDNFHLVDNATLPPPDTIDYKTGRIAPLLHTLKDRCLSVYKAETRELSIDEGSMGWKGHSSMRQYNPNKPHKYHIKSYKLVETKTGYLSNIILHDTTSRTVDEVVLTLLDESPYNEHEGYAVFTDRFYTSPDLFWHLRTVDGFDATGTCMANRHQFPPELKCAKGKSKKGEVHSYIATHGDANLVAMRWKDAKDVYMLSTEETADMVECDTQRGREKKMKPAMVPLYNKNMGGVDLNDYLESRYSPCRATRKMWKKLAMYLVSTAVTNAYIIFRMVCKDRNLKMPRSPHFAFRQALGNIILTMCDTRPPPNVPAALHPAPIGLEHLPASYPPLPLEAQKAAAAGREPRRPPHRCQMPGCKKKSIFFCQGCNVCLCMRPGRICFSEYHRQMKHRLPGNAKQLAVVPPPPDTSTTSSDADEPAARRIIPRRAAKRKAPEPTPPTEPGSAAESVSEQPSKRKSSRLSRGQQSGKVEGLTGGTGASSK